MADTFAARIRQAIGDPGSITTRRPETRDDGLPETGVEPLIAWQARAVTEVVAEHRYAIADSVEGRVNPVTIAALLAVYGLALFAGGLWIGSVWL